MKPIQYRRWIDFSLRMAKRVYTMRGRPNSDWIAGQVRSFFHGLDDYDNGTLIKRIVDWENTEAESGDRGWDFLVCDMMSEHLGDENPFQWGGGEYDKAYDHWEEQWGGPVRCCIRAGLDLASAPSAGVIGFTVCDLRSMYPLAIPDWINDGFMDYEDKPVDLNVGECNVGILL